MIAGADVVIAGAGPAGVATALAAARRGLEVILLDRARFPRDKPCGEGLLPTAVAALGELGLYGRVRPHARRLDGVAFIVPGGPRAEARFRGRDGAPAFGLAIRRRVLDALLVEAAREAPGVTVLEGVAARAPICDGKRVIGLESSVGPLAAKVVVAADGLRSPLRARLGLDRPARGRQRMGLRIHLRLRGTLSRLVEVQLAPPFEYYLTPVGEHELEAAVLGPRAAFVARGLGAKTLQPHLTAALAPLLDGAEPLDRPLGAGPFAQRPRAITTDGALLVGDAAGYLDAITGEGVGLALAQGRAAGDAIADALARGEPTARALEPYVRARRALASGADRLARLALFFAARPRLARSAIALLARRPAVMDRLLALQAGAPRFGACHG